MDGPLREAGFGFQGFLLIGVPTPYLMFHVPLYFKFNKVSGPQKSGGFWFPSHLSIPCSWNGSVWAPRGGVRSRSSAAAAAVVDVGDIFHLVRVNIVREKVAQVLVLLALTTENK